MIPEAESLFPCISQKLPACTAYNPLNAQNIDLKQVIGDAKFAPLDCVVGSPAAVEDQATRTSDIVARRRFCVSMTHMHKKCVTELTSSLPEQC